METVIGIILAVVCLGYLIGRTREASAGSWTGPQTGGMRSRATSGRALRSAGSGRRGAAKTAGKSAAAAVLHPRASHIRAQARADVGHLWETARSTDWLEQRRHERENGPAVQPPASPGDDRRHIPAHDGVPRGPLSNGLAAAGVWKLLPGRVQGALCGCPVCRGKGAGDEEWDRLIRENFGPGANDGAGGPAVPPAKPAPVPPQGSAPAQPASTNGGTVSAGTSTASAEKAIEGINEIHAHAVAGGIHAKREGLKSAHEVAVRAAGMVVTLARQMAEPGSNYGMEITEPLATAGNHFQAAATAVSESDAAISTLINMSVGDLATSARQAPHHGELSESGSR